MIQEVKRFQVSGMSQVSGKQGHDLIYCVCVC